MAKRWDRLAGERGLPVESGRLRRALKLGRLATGVTASAVSAQIKKRVGGGADDGGLSGAARLNAKQIVDVMGEMKGAAMKLGQMLSADPDLVDAGFADHLAALQRTAPPMDFLTLQAQIEGALDQPMTSVFRFFDPEPLGAASIGQVHRATLFDGREVAVKVQYPGVLRSLESDIKNLGSLLNLSRAFVTKARAQAILAEARAVILREADYLAEARAMAEFAQALEGFEGVRVPTPIMALSRPTLLVMRFEPGGKLDEALLSRPRAEREIIAARFVELFIYMFHDLKRLHTDPHPGNFLLSPEGEIVLLDFGCVRAFAPRYTQGVLRLLVAYWADDMAGFLDEMMRMGFGYEGVELPSEAALRDYLTIILEPVGARGPFNFAQWQMHKRSRAFLRAHVGFLKLAPPAEMMLYFRVLVGLKGMMTRVDAAVDIRKIAEDCCRRHGALPASPASPDGAL
ncbi:AarF/ABC1/UbiB kinase family protein [Myxococcota bacterium]|nr:AarF/ABC1/UbiB kinase family protein [Myxococcota bacterium]MBU1900322.1 AarF/ABC1/UbiB kinase family protein [Myxococcota bacterium]